MEEIKINRKPGEKDQESVVGQQKIESHQQLKPENELMVENFMKEYGNIKTAYMLTTSRDGESVRAIYFYPNVIEAVKGYEKYKDWGFAKDYLTITLYGPGGIIERKTLTRPKGGDCTFIRQDYIEAEQILLRYKNKMSKNDYDMLVKEFAGLFSRDNIRFNVSRFFKECQTEEVFE
jgi:hypothetical protein